MSQKENKLILYKDDEGKLSVNTLFADEDVWLTQAQLVEIYQSSKSNISEHLTNIFADNELDKEVVVRKLRTTTALSATKRFCPTLQRHTLHLQVREAFFDLKVQSVALQCGNERFMESYLRKAEIIKL